MSLLVGGENNTKADESDLLALLEISSGCAVAVVGCGGKTSLIELIAMLSIDKKVLVSTTTKTFPMISDKVTLCDTLESCIRHEYFLINVLLRNKFYKRCFASATYDSNSASG